jgi:hypothetical protein
MTGPEHYRLAERLAERLADEALQVGGPEGAEMTAAAQVHATLALAAATALGAESHSTGAQRAPYVALGYYDIEAWKDTAATPQPEMPDY